jgi:UDP-N-acetyl-D-glucosamine dehydrogenase
MLMLNEQGRSAKGARLLLLGLAYKKNTGDARESPAARVAELLVELGAEVRAADPHVVEDHTPAGVTRVELTAGEVAAADAVVLLTDHDAFDFAVLAGARVMDTRHVLAAAPGIEHL